MDCKTARRLLDNTNFVFHKELCQIISSVLGKPIIPERFYSEDTNLLRLTDIVLSDWSQKTPNWKDIILTIDYEYLKPRYYLGKIVRDIIGFWY